MKRHKHSLTYSQTSVTIYIEPHTSKKIYIYSTHKADLSIIIKNYFRLDGRASKKGKTTTPDNSRCARSPVKKHLFQAFTAVSGSTSRKATLTLMLPGKRSESLIFEEKGTLHDGFPSVSFVVDMARCRDV